MRNMTAAQMMVKYADENEGDRPLAHASIPCEVLNGVFMWVSPLEVKV